MVIGGTVVPSYHFESSKKYITVPFELDDSASLSSASSKEAAKPPILSYREKMERKLG